MAKQSHFSQILSAIRFWKLSFNGLEMPFNIFKTSDSIPLYINNQSFYYILKIYLMFACKLYTFIFSTFLWNVCFLFYNLILKAHIFLLYFLKAHSSEFFNRAKCFPIDRNFPHLCWNIVVQLCFIACSFSPTHVPWIFANSCDHLPDGFHFRFPHFSSVSSRCFSFCFGFCLRQYRLS